MSETEILKHIQKYYDLPKKDLQYYVGKTSIFVCKNDGKWHGGAYQGKQGYATFLNEIPLPKNLIKKSKKSKTTSKKYPNKNYKMIIKNMTSKSVSVKAHKRSAPKKRTEKRIIKYPHRVYKTIQQIIGGKTYTRTLKNGIYSKTVKVKKHKRSKPKR